MPNSNQQDPVDFITLRQAAHSNNHRSSHFSTIQATILDLNGHPIRPGLPTPVLRRTASGHLFQPWIQIVKASEMMDPVPTEEEEEIELARWARGEEVRERRKKVCIRNTNINRADADWMKSEGTLATHQETCIDKIEDVHNCNDEREEHRCWVEVLVRSCKPDFNILPATMQIVSSPEEFDHADDVWMQLAKE